MSIKFISSSYVIKPDSGAVAIYSEAKKVSSYNGPCFTVRRSSDDTELDIPFNGKYYDKFVLLNFAGTGSAYIKTWYDQSGNGNNATQTTNDNQPRIVNSGVIDDGLYFDGSDDRLDITSSPTVDITAAPLSIVLTFTTAADCGTSYILSKNLNASTNIQYGLLFNGSNTVSTNLENSARGNAANFVRGTKASFIDSWDGTTVKNYLNGVSKTDGSYNSTLTSRANMQIGCRANTAPAYAAFYKGNIQELIIFNKTVDRIVSNIYNQSKRTHSI